MKDLLILGIGNMILRDEGVGIHVIKALEKQHLFPSNVDLMDGATGGYFLLNDVVEYKRVIMIDATMDELPEGTVRIIHPRYSSDYPTMMSAHEFGLKQMIDAMLFLEQMPEMYLVAVSVKQFQEIGMELSEQIKASVPVVIEAVKKIVQQLIPACHDTEENAIPSYTVG